jgi:hypothetical protein
MQGEEGGGPPDRAGGAVSVESRQIIGVSGQAGDRGHVGVVTRGVPGYRGEQRDRAKVAIADDGFARVGETQGGAGFAPGSVGAISCADARPYACGEAGQIDGGGQDDAQPGEHGRLHRSARADGAADAVEWQLRVHGGDAHR